ncbi:unnamed protein product, partial [Rotaria sp. Silwood2]
LLDFLEDSRETALDIFNNAIKVIENHQLQIQNLSSIGADNANINLDEYHSVFKLFKDRFPNIFKGNCYSHIFHVSVKHAHDELSIDIELTLCKFYSYFSKSAKRVEQLKAYYDFVNLEYKVGYMKNKRQNRYWKKSYKSHAFLGFIGTHKHTMVEFITFTL